MLLKIAARQSDLAKIQALTFGKIMRDAHSGLEVDFHFRESLGDKNLDDPLWKMPEQGVFTQDFYKDLVEGKHDVVVHSWKDLPVEEREDTEIFATLPRAEMRDLFLLKKDRVANVRSSKKLKVLSSSPRRAYNLKPFFSWALPFELDEVEFESVRGNVPTRFKKLLEQDVDGLIVAKAAFDRLLEFEGEEFSGMQSELRSMLGEVHWMVLPLTANPAAAAQGALAVEIRRDREDLKELISKVNCMSTKECVLEERKTLSSYGGGCHQKIGVSVMDRPFGRVKVLRGLTDGGEVLDSMELQREISWPKASEEEVFPIKPDSANFFDRKDVEYDSTKLNQPLWIARANALPESHKADFDQPIWVSGLKTWMKLAKRGYWVNGSAESMGEREDMRLEQLLPRASWQKVTHTRGFGDNILPTYELKNKENGPELVGKKYFYWMSASQFKRALELEPGIAEGYHACGPGHTFDFISQTIDSDRLKVFLSHSHWLKEVLNG